MVIVTVENKGVKFYMRGTTWAFSVERATVFETADDTVAAIAKMAQFHPKALVKRVRIEDAPPVL